MNDEKHRGLRATGIPFARYVLVFVAILGLLLLGPLPNHCVLTEHLQSGFDIE